MDRVSDQRIFNLIQSAVGLPFDPDVVEEDLRVLNSLGEFERIRVESTLQENGDIHLLFTFTEQQIITQISVVGNTLLSDQELLDLVPILPGLGKDNDAIERGRRAIVDIYKKQGNYLVEVFADTILYSKGGVDERTGLQIDESVALIYRVMEGLRVRVKAISFIGNHSFTDKEVSAEVDTNTSVPFFSRGELNESVLETDAHSIRRFYMNRGYRDARVSFRIMLDQNDKEARVKFLIEENAQYILGGVSAQFQTEGDSSPVFTEEQIAGLISMKVGDVYRQVDVANAVGIIERAYGVLGRKVEVDLGADIMKRAKQVFYGGDDLIQQEIVSVVPYHPGPGKQISIIFVIDEGIPTKVGLVTIKGNMVTEDHQIRVRLGFYPGYPFDVQEADRSRERLLRTQLFSKVTMTIRPEDPDNPGYRNLEVDVVERQPGRLNFGIMAGSESGITLHFSIRGESSPNRTTDEILDAINTRSVARPANSPPLRLEQAWLTVCQIRTELLGEEINRDELRKQIDAMIGWIMSADDPANLGRRFAAGKPLKWGFDIERLALLGVAIAFAEAVDDVALAKKSLDFSFVIMNNSYSNLLPPLIAGWLNPVHPIKDSTVCDEVFSDLQSWLVNDSDHFQPEHLPWLDFAHAYVLSSRGLTNEALAVLPSLKSNVPDEPLFLLLQQTSLWKNHRSNPYTSLLSQRWVFDTIHALSIYLLATEVEEKEQSIELLGLQFDGFPKELSDDLLLRLMKYRPPPITGFEEPTQLLLLLLLQEIKAMVIEDKLTDARSFLDLVVSEEFQSKFKKLRESITSEGNLR